MTTRVQLDLADARVTEIDRLRELLGFDTRKELFNQALGILEWTVRQRQMGRVLMVADDEANRLIELSIPFLDRIKKTRSTEESTHTK